MSSGGSPLSCHLRLVGQGVGTAAAQAIESGCLPKDLAANAEIVASVQQTLLRDDAFLVGVQNDDPCDLARLARVSASSERSEGAAGNVLSGQARAVHGEGGVPADRTTAGTHRWMSQTLPASLEMRWPGPAAISEIQLVFDTGMHRALTLSHSDAYAARMVWGQPQPETVSDYTIEGEIEGKWVDLCETKGNYQRLVRHTMDPPRQVTALRVTVIATNGIDHARICEVRAYA